MQEEAPSAFVRDELLRKALPYFPGLKPGPPRAVQPQISVDEGTIPRIKAAISAHAAAFASLGLPKVVVGLSGGLDSTVVATLCMGALGPGRVLTVTVDLGLPEHREQTSWASSVAAELGLPHRIVKADGVLDHLLSLVPERGSFSEVNVMTRVIHGVIFQVADGTAATVASTVNRSEQTLGRHMEHYYGHVTPLASLWKTEVREVARRLDVPQRVINRPSGCAEAWWDYEVLGADWDEVDAFLQSGITEDTDWGGRMKRRVANAQLRGFAAPAKART